jgi:hypothetical protein
MPTKFQTEAEYAHLALNVYDKPPTAWGDWHPVRERMVQDNATGFAACVYTNSKTGEVVVAFRGTDDKTTDVQGADRAILGWKSWDTQFSQALEFTKWVTETYPHAEIKVTGHSLGGSLAQVSSQMYGLKGVAFDPGGAENLIHSAEFKQFARTHRLPERGLSVPHDFENYLVRQSVVSHQSGQHLGRTTEISATYSETLGHKVLKNPMVSGPIIGYGIDQAGRHSMERIVKVFDYAAQHQQLPTQAMVNQLVEPNAAQLAQNHTTEKPTPSLSPVAQTIKQQCHSHVYGFCERNNQPWTEGMDNTVMSLTVVAREAQMSGVDALGVSQGTIYIAQTDRKGIYREAEINSLEAANIPLAQSEQRLAIVDQQMLAQEQQQTIDNLAQTQHKVHSGPRMG